MSVRIEQRSDQITTSTKRFFADVARVFQVPFPGFSAVVWVFFILSYMALPGNPTWRGDLPDPDDFTYLSQTIDWLQGQGGVDNVQHRMNPPFGVAIHYTRFAEMPIAAVIMFFRLFDYSWRGAALLSAFLLPCIYFGVFLWVLRRSVATLVGEEWAGLSSWIALFATALIYKFAPGQVDHHGLEATLTIAAVGLMLRMFQVPDRWGLAAASGTLFALSVAIALEVLPWMALASAVVGFWCAVEGRSAARAASVFGASLFVSGAALLFLDRPVSDIANPDLLSYSVAYVVLEGLIALALFVAACGSFIKGTPRRLAVAAACSLALGWAYLQAFPALLVGPYGAMDPRLAKIFFANLEEALSLLEKHGAVSLLLQIALPILALVASASFARRTRGGERWGWLLLSSFLAGSISLALFYQIRVVVYVQLFSIIPLVEFVRRSWIKIGKNCEGRSRFWAEIFLLVMIGPMTAVLIPAAFDGRAFNTGVLLFPARRSAESCDMTGIEKVLNSPAYAERKLRIVNMLGQGPEILFYTDHEVLAAPYHTNVKGNLDAFEFFSTHDPEKAKQIARDNGINMVVLCRRIPDMYLSGTGPHYTLSREGFIKMIPDDSFAGQLALRNFPDWLTEVPVPTYAQYRLFEVK